MESVLLIVAGTGSAETELNVPLLMSHFQLFHNLYFDKVYNIVELFYFLFSSSETLQVNSRYKIESLKNSFIGIVVGVRIPYRLLGESPSLGNSLRGGAVGVRTRCKLFPE